MNKWDPMRDRVNSWEANNLTYQSNIASLLEIFDYAEEWELDPTYAKNASRSNLREIIYEAKKAINKNQPVRLQELFQLAAEMKTKDLRLWLRGEERDVIVARKVPFGKSHQYLIQLTKKQLERIQKATELNFIFMIKEEDEKDEQQ